MDRASPVLPIKSELALRRSPPESRAENTRSGLMKPLRFLPRQDPHQVGNPVQEKPHHLGHSSLRLVKF